MWVVVSIHKMSHNQPESTAVSIGRHAMISPRQEICEIKHFSSGQGSKCFNKLYSYNISR